MRNIKLFAVPNALSWKIVPILAWYVFEFVLIVPQGDPPKLDAPNSTWTIDSTYPTLSACNKVLTDRLVIALQKVPSDRNEVMKTRNAQCLDSNDPSLH